MGVLWDLAERAGITLLRHQRLLHRRLHEGRASSPARGRDLSAPAGGRLDRLAPLARGLRLDLRARRRRHLALLDQRRHRPLHRLRRRRRHCSPSTAASCRRARSAPRSRPGTRTASSVIDEVGELVVTEPMPSMPVFFWGDEDGSRYRDSYFEHVPRRLAPRRLDRDHRARHGDHLRPLGLDDQPRRHPHGDERDLPRRARPSTRSSTRSSSTSRGPGPRAGCRSSSSCARAPSSTTTCAARSSAAIREQCSPRHVPDEVFADRRGAAHAQRQGARGAGEADPDGRRRAEQAASRDSLANPGGARLLHRAGREAGASPA